MWKLVVKLGNVLYVKVRLCQLAEWDISLVSHNCSKNFMKVGVDVKCMETKFGGCGLSSFGDFAYLQKRSNCPF